MDDDLTTFVTALVSAFGGAVIQSSHKDHWVARNGDFGIYSAFRRIFPQVIRAKPSLSFESRLSDTVDLQGMPKR